MQLICCMIARDNESTVAAAIRSVIGHVDQVVLCDTGSMDATLRIAYDMGAVVHAIKWSDHFAKARNQALAFVKADWVLTIDADEVFVWNDVRSLKEWLADFSSEKDVIVFECFHHETSSDQLLSKTHVERLFSPDHFKFEGKIHETLVPVESKSIKRTATLSYGHFIHYGYSMEYNAAKHRRNVWILNQAIRDEPDQGRYYRYLANECFNAEQYVEAVQLAASALQKINMNETYLRAQAHYYLMMAYLKQNDIERAIQAANACIVEIPNYPDPYGILGEIYFYLQCWDESFQWFCLWEQYMDVRGLFPSYSISIQGPLREHKLQAEVMRLFYRGLEKGTCKLKVLILVRDCQLEQDWVGLLHHLNEHFKEIPYEIGIWMQEQVQGARRLEKSWLKKNRIHSVDAWTHIEASLKIAANTNASHVWLWDANERLTAEIDEEKFDNALSLAGSILVSTQSDRLGYRMLEQRIWPVKVLENERIAAAQEVAASVQEGHFHANTSYDGYQSIRVVKPLFIPIEIREQYFSAHAISEPIKRLLVAFGSQQFDVVYSMKEPEKNTRAWVSFRFYRILAAFNLNQIEQAAELIYDAIDAEIESSLMLDFIYMYGKLAQHAQVQEMKLEAIDLLESTLADQQLLETFHVKTGESNWLSLIGELQWQCGKQQQAIISLRHSLESSAYLNTESAYRLAEMVYFQHKSEGNEKIARVLIEMFSEQSPKARSLLYPVFSFLNMQEWALIFQQAWMTAYPINLEEKHEGPLVSIILPVYNDSLYLLEAIQSILSQTHLNLELIIVDDGSEANIAGIVKRFSYDARVKYHRLKTNRGLPYALNYGISQAKGIIMGWTSADNKAHSRWIERMIEELTRHPQASAVYSDYYHIDENGLIFEEKRMSTYKLNGLQNGGPSMLWKASVLKYSGGFDESLFGIEDRDFTVRLAMTGPVIRVPELLYYYRIHGNSLSSQIDSGSHGGWTELHDKLKKKWMYLSFI